MPAVISASRRRMSTNVATTASRERGRARHPQRRAVERRPLPARGAEELARDGIEDRARERALVIDEARRGRTSSAGRSRS